MDLDLDRLKILYRELPTAVNPSYLNLLVETKWIKLREEAFAWVA